MSADAVLWIVMAFCLIVGCPIFVSLGVASTLALILTNIPMRIVALDMLKVMDMFPLLAVVGFIFAGALMEKGGMARQIVDVASLFVGRIRGGLGITTILGCLFFAAMIAISAMVLPGISGSTLLLIFGLYVPIMGAVRSVMGFDFAYAPILGVFVLGVVCGVLLFVRLIRFCLRRYRSQTIYCIVGMMIGSLYSIAQGPLTLASPMPAMGLGQFSVLFFLIGGAVVAGLQLLKRKLDDTPDENHKDR